MFIIGHIGLTIGLMIIGLIIFNKTNLISKIDFRLVVLFAILPDIIDKTIGHIVFYGQLNNGRLFSHTLVFLIIFILIFSLVIRSRWWVYSFPIITHQVFDHLWTDPETWFWPYYGWGFNAFDIDIWAHWFEALVSDPYIYISEILGIIVLVIIIMNFKLYNKTKLTQILKTGKI